MVPQKQNTTTVYAAPGSTVVVGIDAEYREVAGLARPHPVVCIATKLTHRLWYGITVLVSIGRRLYAIIRWEKLDP